MFALIFHPLVEKAYLIAVLQDLQSTILEPR